MVNTGMGLAMFPGMKVTLVVSGYFTRKKDLTITNEITGEKETKTLKNGFYVENEEIGTIDTVEGKTSVVYTHKKSQENSVWFVALTEVNGEPEIGVFRIVDVPIHDHASLITGGPAHATYHSEGYREITEEET